ncbi:TPA: fimbrillin family protein [Elizabethkingia anophelis]
MGRRFTSLLVTLFFLLIGCRSADSDSVGGGLSSVRFNISGLEFSESKSARASVEGYNSSIQEYTQLQSIPFNTDIRLTAELVPCEQSDRANVIKGHAAVGGTLAADNNQLDTGSKFRVFVYKKEDGTYVSHHDYTIGSRGNSIALEEGVSYDIVIYSFGTNWLPSLNDNEARQNLNNATVGYHDRYRDFLYQKIENYIPKKGDNTLDIRLKHKVAQVTINMSSDIGVVENVQNGFLLPHYSDGTFALSTGSISGNSTIGRIGLSFNNQYTVTTPEFINANTNGEKKGGFSADITVGGITTAVSMPDSFVIKPGVRYTLNLKLEKTGEIIKTIIANNDDERMFDDNEPLEVMTSAQRRFKISEVLRIKQVEKDIIEIANFAPINLTDVTIVLKVGGGKTRKLFKADIIGANVIKRIPFALNLPEGQSLSAAEFDFEGASPVLQKLKELRSILWTLQPSDIDNINDPNDNWIDTPLPKHFRSINGVMINLAYVALDPRLKERFLQASIVNNTGVKFLTRDDKINDIGRLQGERYLKVGIVDPRNGALGLGAGSTYGLDYVMIKYNYNPLRINDVAGHEMGHVLGYDHYSNMTYPGTYNNVWQGFSLIYRDVQKLLMEERGLPILEDLYYLPSDIKL